jgi:hypothetical protein
MANPPFVVVEANPRTKTSSLITPSEIFTLLISPSLLELLIGLRNEHFTAQRKTSSP